MTLPTWSNGGGVSSGKSLCGRPINNRIIPLAEVIA